jgi:hypothetical protein
VKDNYGILQGPTMQLSLKEKKKKKKKKKKKNRGGQNAKLPF